MVSVTGIQDRAAVRVENHVRRLACTHQLPRIARVLATPDAAIGAAQRGINDHLAGWRELGIDDNLKGCRADKYPIARRRVDRQQVAAGVNVVRAIVKVPGRSTVLGDQEARRQCSRCHLRPWRR